jgi:alanine dehydrogenase
VKVFDNNVSRLQRLQNNLGQRVWTSVLEPKILAKQLKTCEVAVGALRNEFGRAPIVVSEEMVAAMRPGSIIIDVAIDRGGCFETSEINSLKKSLERRGSATVSDVKTNKKINKNQFKLTASHNLRPN